MLLLFSLYSSFMPLSRQLQDRRSKLFADEVIFRQCDRTNPFGVCAVFCGRFFRIAKNIFPLTVNNNVGIYSRGLIVINAPDKHIIHAAAILGVSAAAAVMISGIPAAVHSNAPVFQTVSPVVREYTETVSGSGIISFAQQYDITSSLPLVISRFAVYEGDYVCAGDTIAYVDRKSSAALIESYGKIAALAISAADLSTAVSLIPETITADCTGRIISTCASGCAVQSGSSIANVAADSALIVTAAISELDIASVAVGDSACFTLSAYPDEVFTGTVSSIANAARCQYNGSVLETVVDVQIKPDTADYRLKSGLSAHTDILLGEPRKTLVVPYSAISQDSGGEYVWVYDSGSDGKQSPVVLRRNITTGVEFSDGAEIVSGLCADDILLNNSAEITESTRIRIKATDELTEINTVSEGGQK